MEFPPPFEKGIILLKLDFLHTRKRTSQEGVLELFQTFKDGKRVCIWRSTTISGQKGFENTQWVRGKSPIPAFENGWLHLAPKQPNQFETGYSGIGEFWPISSGDNPDIITSGKANEKRTHIGWHLDNALPGTAGCIAAPDTEVHKRKFILLSDTLKKVAASGQKRIQFNSKIVS